MGASVALTLTKREIIQDRLAITCIGTISFVLLTALGAYIYIPLGFTPVPITLQTFFVLLSGALLGRRLGSLSQGIYLLLGGLGLPIFLSGAFGFYYILGPTCGYLVGFVAASYIIGRMLKNSESTAAILSALIVGELVILFCGAGWLKFGLGLGTRKAFYLGVLPFVPADTIKIIVAAFICRKYLQRSKQLFYN